MGWSSVSVASDMTRRMRLAAYVQGVGASQAVWRSPRTDASKALTLGHWAEIASTAEAGRFDVVFVADALTIGEQIATDSTERPDPIALLGALAAVTDSIGLIGTVSTTFSDPFTVARQFATLDHLSGGRVGWNIVTTAIQAAANNFGSANLPVHADRYERAEEFVEIVTRLWDAWDADAIVADRATGRYVDLERVHPINHVGEHFSVEGPLPVRRSPQGRITLSQAGSSGPGMALGAKWADLAFTTQFDQADSRDFAQRMHAQAAEFGRAEDAISVLPGIMPIIGSTEAEARAHADELAGFVDVGALGAFLSHHFGGLDLSDLDPDGPFPDVRDDLPANASVSRPRLYIETALREGLSVRRLAQRIAMSLGHRPVIGTPEQVADDLAGWFGNGAADGFVVLAADLPEGLRDFTEHVVPLLQDRGLVQRDYAPGTLRERIGA
ncbi:LLM class flavin-dependent oxidoreductase [Microbacterium sp. CFH 31415]|uniref:LLM class flavin-dependent oxidoreductase n=1 Tax=Microbacterium sp. CFH 31415 TaxID=2921732 RepID=UPI001F13C0AB|nr:LLM class flavin-dependent oxidoreductase [Microbacterium sp. CFH 31415]MCH6231620.1 LLM class flavin-dependent oxidoreductase [Microbacterium sp. CFH 31415]